MLPPIPPEGYYGQILTGEYSLKLRHAVAEQFASCTALDRLGLSVMPYIAAWRIDRPGLWYEFVSARFLELFHCGPATIASAFRDSIIDHRQYRHKNVYPDVQESILDRADLENQRLRLRQESAAQGVGEVIYKVVLPNRQNVWLKDCSSVTRFEEDGICLSPGYLCNVSLEMSRKDHLDEVNEIVTREKHLLVEAERSAALGQISAKIFHEIRNPIVSIGGLAKRLLQKPEADNSQKYLEVIVREAGRLENVLANLFSYTKTADFAPEPSDLAALARNVIDLLQSELDRQHIAIAFTVTGTIPPIGIDREQIRLALIHILKNSVEAMPLGGRLSITIGRHGDRVILSVLDSGLGIPAGYARRVVEPFFTTKVYGTGLGLSLAQKAVDLHAGKLDFRHPATGGTEVIMELPVADQ